MHVPTYGRISLGPCGPRGRVKKTMLFKLDSERFPMTCTSAESRGTHCSLQLRRTQVPTEESGWLTLFTIMPACGRNSVTD